ncbi:MAG TPA: hypothetical protein VGJ92_12245 [Methanocella sp.]|jgi:hypothetical protein
MKNNMILMLAAIIAMFTLAIALYGASATLLGQPAAPVSADNESGLVTPVPDEIAATGTDAMKTAFGALSVSSANPAVKAWMADKRIVYVASISSDFCEDGLSDTWTITYASDDGQIIACVIQGAVVDVRQALSSPQQGLDPGKAIDSAEVWQKVSGNIVAAGGLAPEAASMTLKVTGGKPRWDVSYEAADGFHIMRVDAGNGTITDNVTIGQG